MGCLWGCCVLKKTAALGWGVKRKKKRVGTHISAILENKVGNLILEEDMKNFQRVNGSRSWEKCLCF